MIRIAATAIALGLAASASAAPFTVSLETEAPGIQNSTSGFSAVGIETFEGRPQGDGQSFISDFGGSVFRGAYNGVRVNGADQYGGAGGAGQYAVTFTNSGYTLDLSSTQPGGVTYFGFWLSALDRGNTLTFQRNGVTQFTFGAADAKAFIDGLTNSSQYYGNPNAAFSGQNTGEPYAFLNFYARGGTTFDRIVFAESPEVGGYESDNHTVGRWTRISGTVIGGISAVPEPGTWAMMILGFGMIGFAARRRAAATASA